MNPALKALQTLLVVMADDGIHLGNDARGYLIPALEIALNVSQDNNMEAIEEAIDAILRHPALV